ncbi:MAG: hypothetical protein IJA57_06460 [Alistipes sp.]|nr:hypothetical protein [Alistipes sp.]
MRIPPIDLTDIIKILKREGADELTSSLRSPGGYSIGTIGILAEWNKIIKVLEFDLIPQLAKGGEIGNLLPAAKALSKSVGALSLMASQFLSFVPGPIGIVCSIINAIVCFTSGNIIGGLLELLGCIPGAKFGVKGGCKIATTIGNKVIKLIEKNPELAKVLKNWEKIVEKKDLLTKDFNFTKIKEATEKIQKEIVRIENNLQKPVRKLDTCASYDLNFNHLTNKRGIQQNILGQTINKGQQHNISTYGISGTTSPQAVIRLWK